MRATSTYSIYGVAVLAVLAVSVSISLQTAYAQDALIAEEYPAKAQVTAGDIVSFDPATASVFPTQKPEDTNMWGVAVSDPLILYTGGTGGVQVARSGVVSVRVMTRAGTIKAGDYVTSSDVPGIGERAGTGSGYVLGTAVQDLDISSVQNQTVGSSTVQIGAVLVSVSIGPPAESAAQQVSGGVLGIAPESPAALLVRALQLLIGLVIAGGSIVFAYRSLSGSIANGVISVGRNPLATSSIRSMVVFSSIVVILISVAGVAAGAFIMLFPITKFFSL